jgi:hypothetical protein
VHLPAGESFPYLRVRASILGSTSPRSRGRQWRAGSSRHLEEEKTHIFSATKELVGIAKHHYFLLGQMIPAMQMVVSARLRYSAALASVQWTDAELDRVHESP